MKESNALNITYGDHGESFRPEGFSTLVLRGQMPDRPYVACIGGGHVFGRYVEQPWPALLRRPVLNLGIGDASPTTFRDTRLMRLINDAELAIVTVMTARNQGQPWLRNEDGLKGCIMTDGRTYDEYWRGLVKTAEGCVQKLRSQVWKARNEWSSDMNGLLQAITCPKLVVWISPRRPDYTLRPRTLHGVYGLYPHLVRPGMLPRGTKMIVQSYAGNYYPGQLAHRKIAQSVRKLVARFLDSKKG